MPWFFNTECQKKEFGIVTDHREIEHITGSSYLTIAAVFMQHAYQILSKHKKRLKTQNIAFERAPGTRCCFRKEHGIAHMDMLIKECGNLLKRLEEQRNTAQSQSIDEKRIYRNMIAEYKKVLLRLEQRLNRQDVKTYLEVRRARHAVKTGMEQTIPADVLYAWMVQNICDLEG